MPRALRTSESNSRRRSCPTGIHHLGVSPSMLARIGLVCAAALTATCDSSIPGPETASRSTAASASGSDVSGDPQLFLNGYRLRDLPSDIGLQLVVPPVPGRPGLTMFSHGGSKSRLMDRLVVDEGGAVWRCPALVDRVDCVLLAHIDSVLFASMAGLRAEAAQGEMGTVSRACDYPCGVVAVEVRVVERGSNAPSSVVLGTDGEVRSRRTSAAADRLLRWILAIRVETAYVE